MLQDASVPMVDSTAGALSRSLFSERSLLAEEILPPLVLQCQGARHGAGAGDKSVDISPVCNVLTSGWSRLQKQSRGVHLFRELAQEFSLDPSNGVCL